MLSYEGKHFAPQADCKWAPPHCFLDMSQESRTNDLGYSIEWEGAVAIALAIVSISSAYASLCLFPGQQQV